MGLISIKQINPHFDLFSIVILVLDHEADDILGAWKEKVCVLGLEFPFLMEEIRIKQERVGSSDHRASPVDSTLLGGVDREGAFDHLVEMTSQLDQEELGALVWGEKDDRLF